MSEKYSHYKYVLAIWPGSLYVRHQWSLIGELGGIEFCFSIKNDDELSDNLICNLEFHHFSGEGAPDYLNCPIIGSTCWHKSASSLYASENIWPKIKQSFIHNNHPEIFRVLEMAYERHFIPHKDWTL